MTPTVAAQSEDTKITALFRQPEGPAGSGPAQKPIEATRPGELCLKTVDLKEESILAIGDRLTPGDILSSGHCREDSSSDYRAEVGQSTRVSVELTCGEGVIQRFSSREFLRAIVLDNCRVKLLNGTLDLLTDEPVEVDLAGRTIGVEGTRLTVIRSGGVGAPGSRGEDPRNEERVTCLLFDGRATIDTGERGGGRPLPVILEPGQRWSRFGEETIRSGIDDTYFTAVAERSAWLDVARAFALGQSLSPDAVASKLYSLYRKVLTRPRDRASRVELARSLFDYGLEDRAFFELREVGIDITTERELRDLGPDSIQEPTVSPGSSPPETSGGDGAEGQPAPGQIPPPISVVSGSVPEVGVSKTHLTADQLAYLFLTFPDDRRPGERISGMLDISMLRESKKARKKLQKLTLEIGGQKIAIAEGSWTTELPSIGKQLELAVKRERKVLSSRSLDWTQPRVATTEFAGPSFCDGKPMTISGPFDGDHRTTKLSSGGRPVPILTETVRSISIVCPATLGWQELKLQERDRQLTLPRFYAFDLDFEVKSQLQRGEVTTAHLQLRGLKGFGPSVGVRITNLKPKIASLEGGDKQVLTFSVADLDANGAVSRELQVRGRKRGKGSFKVELVMPDR